MESKGEINSQFKPALSTEELTRQYKAIIQILSKIPIITNRDENVVRLKRKLKTVIKNDSQPPAEKIYALFDILATEFHMVSNSFGGSNSKLAHTLHSVCSDLFGVDLIQHKLQENGLLSKMLADNTHSLKNINEFDRSTQHSTGGVTGSVRVKKISDENLYQLKPSILDKELTLNMQGWTNVLRRLKASDTDRENFGEVIASSIGCAILPGLSPEVSLVYNRERQKMSVASKYLVGKKVRTLDDYAREHGVSFSSDKHAVFVAEELNPSDRKSGKMPLNTEDMNSLNPFLAKAIVLSAVVGDHDVNPGNMIVVTN